MIRIRKKGDFFLQQIVFRPLLYYFIQSAKRIKTTYLSVQTIHRIQIYKRNNVPREYFCSLPFTSSFPSIRI